MAKLLTQSPSGAHHDYRMPATASVPPSAAIGRREPRGHMLARAQVGLVDRLTRHDTAPRFGSGMFEAGQARHRLAAHAVSNVIGEAGQQAEVRVDHFEVWYRLVTGIALCGPADDVCDLRRVSVRSAAGWLSLGGQSEAVALLDELAAPFGLVVTAHGDSVTGGQRCAVIYPPACLSVADDRRVCLSKACPQHLMPRLHGGAGVQARRSEPHDLLRQGGRDALVDP